MTDQEKEACEPLLKISVEEAGLDDATDDEDVAHPANEPSSPDLKDAVLQRDHDIAIGQDATSPYVNCDFIYGSAAEVEHLWSIA